MFQIAELETQNIEPRFYYVDELGDLVAVQETPPVTFPATFYYPATNHADCQEIGYPAAAQV